ncbi:lysogenization protein HflD [Sulfurifustis variabilis]|uniref:High frequency lysogenization protein HflD homolog n=1 Tax=Sulfurifustis variabilis TaxID=1675686 RepID=A0A1B4V027_9GAMM|nr:high frequency lysogenization protein HflD [Sulfurifustis variabilis]BAU46780.1 lysogenization protein HflD [Sulfurifustis variabilis]
MSNAQDKVLALAGMFQAARLVQKLARDGRTETRPFAASVRSVLMIDAENAAEVYGGVGGVALGLKLLRDKLSGSAEPSDLELAKYVISMLQLEAALRRRPEVAEAIRAGVRAAETQMSLFHGESEDEEEEDDADTVHPRLVDLLAELYTQTLSTLNPRIMVSGEHGHLSNPEIAARVRAGLFAGIRSAVLWRQLGGNRWQLVLQRRAIAQEAERLLKSAERQ